MQQHVPSPLGALSALLGGWLLLTPAAEARPRQTEEVQEQASEAAHNERETERLIHLTDGRVLRGRAKWNDGLWLVQTEHRGWIEVPEERVERVEYELRVLREAKLRGRKIRPGDSDESVAARFELAEWLAAEGLRPEALRKLDKVLDARPDHAGAHALLRELPLTVRMPSLDVPLAEYAEALDDFLRRAAYAPPTAQERAIEALREEDERGLLFERLSHELVKPDRERRAFAGLALRRLFPAEYGEDHVTRLLRRAVLDVDDTVRRNASLALRDLSEPGVTVPVIKALESDSVHVQQNAAEALGLMEYPEAVEPLVRALHRVGTRANLQSGGSSRGPAGHVYIGNQVAYVGDYDLEIAQGASIADPIVSVVESAVVLEGRSNGISGYTFVTHRKVIRGSLQGLTGQDPGDRNAHWQKWWDEHGSEWSERYGRPAADR